MALFTAVVTILIVNTHILLFKMSPHGKMLTYGVLKDDGILYHIDDKRIKKGLKCDCLCPKCNTPLIARRGDVNEHHFAHVNGDKCPGARMSALHKLAQQILAAEKKVMLPLYSKTHVQHPANLQVFDSIVLEEVCKDEISKRRPDCIGKPYGNGNSLWIEIYCSNPINKEREQDINRRNQYCIEIDFSDLYQTDYKPDNVKEKLLNSSSSRWWICHPEWDKEELQKEAEAERQQLDAKRKIAEETRLRLAEIERQQKEYQRQQLEEIRKQAERLKSQSRVSISDSFPRSIRANDNAPKPQSNGKRDWVMYAKQMYGDNNGRQTFYNTLIKEYTRVTLENSERLVADELRTRVNDLLPRTHLIADVNKIYLELLLAIWVLDKLNHSEVSDLSKLFVMNQTLRNNIFRTIKQIGSINHREIGETLIPVELENGDVILQILRICYK